MSEAGMVKQGERPLVALKDEVRSALTTGEAARHLGRAEQTLRIWACKKNGPITPMDVGGRLMWRVADLRRVLGEEA
jgi:hypothetical protein